MGGFWDPSWAPTKWVPEAFSQDASKRRPRGFQEPQKRPKSAPRAPQECPRAPQERPRATKTCPGNAHGAIRGALCDVFLLFFMVFFVFRRFSVFFCVFLRFFAFFCVFSTVLPPLTVQPPLTALLPPNFSTPLKRFEKEVGKQF